jgi:co-chaperonin GroES (HSP10)
LAKLKNEAGLVLTGIRILVKPPKLEEKTAGGIVLASATKEKEEKAQTTGTLVDAAEEAWKCKEMGGIVVGDTLFFARYAGAGCEFTVDGTVYRVMNASDVIGKIEKRHDSQFQAAQSTAETFGVDIGGSEVRYGT